MFLDVEVERSKWVTAVDEKNSREAFNHSVADLVSLLKTRLYAGNLPDLQVRVNESAERVKDALAFHIREFELYTFPILRGICPELSDQVQDLAKQHDALMASAELMTDDVKGGRILAALDAIRRLVWALIEHTDHQEFVVNRILENRKMPQPRYAPPHVRMLVTCDFREAASSFKRWGGGLVRTDNPSRSCEEFSGDMVLSNRMRTNKASRPGTRSGPSTAGDRLNCAARMGRTL